ncbi:hypothetical protein [Sphingomonas sanguinis]|uniref:hypothetical protein n=1 Tax=Sphingomonas sanguinis TaxID=33051 RepID=UPI00077BC805|nr:hypothetical protein [Sphingomonas sanguinis]
MAAGLYERQVAPGRTAPLDMASAESFGANVGRSISELGESIDRYHLVERRLQRNEDSAAAGKSFAEYRLAASGAIKDMRTAAQPGGAGHADAVKSYLTEHGQTLLDGITDPHVRRQLDEQMASFNAGLIDGEDTWQRGQRVAKLGADEKVAAQTGYSRITTAASLPEAQQVIGEEREAAHARIKSYTDINADQQAALLREYDQGLARTTLAMVVRTDPAVAEGMLKQGGFSDLPPEEVEQGFRAAGVEQRRLQAIAEHKVALEKAAAREQLATFDARVSSGEDIGDADFTKAEQLARGIGDDSGVVRIHTARIKSGVNRETQGWTPQQYQTEIQRLRAKGQKRSADEDIYLNQLETIAPNRTTEFRKDPGTWAALNGNPPPPLVPGNTASLARRREWQSSVSRTTGLPTPFLQPQEVESYRALLAESPKARVDVANQLASFGGMTAVQAARQVAPDDDMLARLVVLQPGDRAAASNGAEARKAHPQMIDGKAGKTAQDLFLKRVGPATALMGQDDVAAAFDIARNLYADYAVKRGIQEFEPQIWNAFVHRSLGGTRDAQGRFFGGLGSWGGTNVLLPPKLNQSQFEAVMTRMNWKSDQANAPAWRNGTAMTPADVRKFTPVQRPDGRYEFHGPGGAVLRTKQGSVWSLDIGALGARYLP